MGVFWVRMKLVIDVPDSLLDKIRTAVRRGDYDNPREFVTVALENQAEMELSNTRPDDVMTLGQAIDSGDSEPMTDGNFSAVPQQTVGNYGLSTLGRGEYDRISTVSMPKRERVGEDPLWGQYNRVFPVKLITRILANELRDQAIHTTSQVNGSEDQWISLDRFNEEAAELAREYGLKIKQADKEKNRGRGEKLSAALPVGDDATKSKNRFQMHFIGYAEQNGDLSGAAPELLLVSIPPDSMKLIGITEPGLEFAEMWNPLLDGGVSSDQSLSEEEVSFYLSHICQERPSEFEAMQLAAEAIAKGDDRPDSLSSQVSTLNDNWSEAQANTVRSGLVSRMFELGLISRERVGQRGIAYKLTDQGNTLLNHNKNDE